MFTLRLQMCLQLSAAGSSIRSSGLVRLLDAVSKCNSDNSSSAMAIRFTGDDIYKICALIHAKDDPLHLREEHSFVNAIAHSYWHHNDEVLSPFQKALIERVLPSSTCEVNNAGKYKGSAEKCKQESCDNRNSTSHESVETTIKYESSSSSSSSKSNVQKNIKTTKSLSFATSVATYTQNEPTMNERLSAIWEIINERQETAHISKHEDDNSSVCNDGAHGTTANNSPGNNNKINNKNNNYSIGNDAMQQIHGHITAMEGHFKELTLFDLCRVIKALAMINYQNYEHTSLLGRCACAVISNEPLPRRELCQLYFNLHKLNTRDSLTPIVNRIIALVNELTAEEVFLIAQSLERHMNTGSSGARLMRALALRATCTMKDAHSASYHRALLVAMSRYMLHQHPSVATIVHDLHRFINNIHVNDLLDILQACVDLKVYTRVKPQLPLKSSMHAMINTSSNKTLTSRNSVNKPIHQDITTNTNNTISSKDNETSNPYPMLITRLTVLALEVDVHMISNVMAILSTLPTETTEVMQRLMTRLENDAGSLSVGELTNILNLLSTYPPSRGSVCVVSLAFAAAVRARGIDHALLEDILISLSMMQHFTDDFYTIFEVMQRQKGGIRQFDTLASLLENCTPEVIADARGEALVSNAIITMASKLTDSEVAHCRSLLKKLNFNNREVMARLSSRASQNTMRDGARHRYPTAEDELEMSMLEKLIVTNY